MPTRHHRFCSKPAPWPPGFRSSALGDPRSLLRAQRQKRVHRIAVPASKRRGPAANHQLCGRGEPKVDAPAAGFGSGRGGRDARPRGRGLSSLRPGAQRPAVFPVGRQAGARRPQNNKQEPGGARRGAPSTVRPARGACIGWKQPGRQPVNAQVTPINPRKHDDVFNPRRTPWENPATAAGRPAWPPS